ncbi:putative hydrolase [Gordonia effusa NBRC 100432]|uniref:Putative hydrolase n=1 Tax=Gordonia effusa NBRC 100432 TaxID=1077974 RepID=H0R5P5_9ACTN|nr:MazG family protein [Gordonia effusa]GAB20396.1 putative hydrolase [Gordonia effusa NBRC 100432]
MTVILLDPLRPEVLPLAAMKFVVGPVLVTEDVHPTTLWALQNAAAAPVNDDGDPLTVLMSTDRSHPLVRARIDRGEVVIAVQRHSGDALVEAVALMDTLRRNGPWESQQTHDSLRRYLLEEVYELLDAIDVGTQDDLREELGDLLLQVLFHARIAADDRVAPFDIDDVARSFVAKVSHRTPGILSGEHSDLETQIREWEERKAAEKARGSILDGIATTAPALALAQKVLERLAAAGFPKPEVDPELLSVTVDVGGRSTEDLTRQRVLDLMDRVYAAESSAQAAGVALTNPTQWLEHLGVADDYVAQDDSAQEGAEQEGAAPNVSSEPDAAQEPTERTNSGPADPLPEDARESTSTDEVATADDETSTDDFVPVPDDGGLRDDDESATAQPDLDDDVSLDDYYGSESIDEVAADSNDAGDTQTPEPGAPNVVPRSPRED